MPKLLPPIEKRFTPGHDRGNGGPKPTPYAQAVALQRLILDKCEDPKIAPLCLSSLARAWSELEDRKRILRGIPLPGQLRPDLDPVQMMKAIKRSRTRRPIELQADAPAFTGPIEEEAIEVEPGPQAKAGPEPEPEGTGPKTTT